MKLKSILRYAVIGAKYEAEEHAEVANNFLHVDNERYLLHCDMENKCKKDLEKLVKMYRNAEIEVK